VSFVTSPSRAPLEPHLSAAQSDRRIFMLNAQLKVAYRAQQKVRRSVCGFRENDVLRA
jgi:hypothetical protein